MRPTVRLTETIAPRRLGRSFRWLLAATIVNNVGDGVVISAGPLLVASQTRDPFLVSMALLSEYLPALLFGVLGGAAGRPLRPAADGRRRQHRSRRRPRGPGRRHRVSGTVNIAVVLVVLFVLGTAETFADSASSTLIPSLVAREDLGIANARMQGAFVLTNQLLPPPVGAFLFAVGHGPAVRDERGLLRARRGARLAGGDRHARAVGGAAAVCAAEMAEGIRWLVAHPPMRTLALTIFTFNVTFGAAWSVLVLYAGERLGMDEVGFGLLTTAVAIGGARRARCRTGASSGASRWPTSCASGCSSRLRPTSCWP